MTLRAHAVLAGALLGALAAAAVDVWIAYTLGPLAAVALPAAVIGSVLIARDPLFGVCAALLAVTLEAFGLRAGGGAGLSVTELCLFVAAASAAPRIVLDGVGRPVSPAHRAFIVLIGFAALGLTVAEDTFVVLKIVLVWSALTTLSIYLSGQEPGRVEPVIVSIALAGGALGLLAIAGAGELELQDGGAVASGRAQGSFDQPNLLGFFLALCIPLAVVESGRGGWWRRASMLAAVGFALAGLMLSLSRTSIIGTLVAFGVLLALPAFRRVAVVAVVGMLLFSVFNLEALQKSAQVSVVGQRLGTLRDQGAVDEGRFEMWTRTPGIVADHVLLGVGEGNYGTVSEDYGIRDPDGLPYDHAHNVPLTIAAETGLGGLVALLAFIALLAAAGRRALRDRDAPTWPLAVALVAALCTLVTTGLGDYPLRSNPIMALIMIEAGLILALAGRAARSDRPSARP